tara:strand:- start:10152 stop:10607 length:456 start_codon:yes stop_codon:yes gene_type:complete
LKRSPLHERLADAGAIFGVTAGCGRPLYFAVSGDDTLPYSYTEQPWWTLAEAECAAMSRGAGIIEVYAREGQPVACTPWTLAGAMSPCIVAGTLAQVLAEALATMALVQLINPGAPCLMGSFASTISMQNCRRLLNRARQSYCTDTLAVTP